QIFFLYAQRCLFHPLATYPGPRLAALTSWYATYYAARGNLHEKTHEWHRIYGPIVRINPDSLCFNTATAHAAIYNTSALVRKDEKYGGLSVSRRTPNLLTSIEKDLTRFKRKVHTRFLGSQNLQDSQIQSRILAQIARFHEVLDRGGDSTTRHSHSGGDWGDLTDMAKVCNWMALDIISDLSFGKAVGLLHNPERRWFVNAIATMSWRGIVHAFQPAIYKWRLESPLSTLLAPTYELMGSLGNWARAESAACAGEESDKPAFIRMARDAENMEKGLRFGQKELWVESVMMLVAGSDTTSATLSAVFHHLLHNPSIHHLAKQEIRNTFQDADSIRPGKTLDSCTYLNACIKESLRLNPAVANFLPRRVDSLAGIEIDGQRIPDGTIVGVSLFALHRNEVYFHKPNGYHPERWIAEENHATHLGTGASALQEKAFNPFSAGPRMCVGSKLAWMELKVTIAKTLFSLDMQLKSGYCACSKACPKATGEWRSDCDFPMKSYATAFVKGPMVQVRRRKPTASI
ncbi:cytochrome P450, partial [Periconia macrospinosa]